VYYGFDAAAVVLGFGAMWFCRLMPMFQRNILLPPMKPRDAKTQDNTSIILTTVKTSDLTAMVLFE
jgi:hypothetical protein